MVVIKRVDCMCMLAREYSNVESDTSLISEKYYKWQVRTLSDEQGFFAKYLHAFVSVFQNKCHLKHFNCLSILRNRYNPIDNRYRL